MAKYTDKFRAEAVALLEAAGYPEKKGALQRVSDSLGVPNVTVARWFKRQSNPPPNELVTQKRADLVGALQNEIAAALKQMGTARESASYRDLGVVIGILADKLQLLQGHATGRQENKIIIEYGNDPINITDAAHWSTEDH